MKFALATANKGKIPEISNIIGKLGLNAVTRNELGIDVSIDETGTTFYENALIKAKAICDITGLPSIADDSGLCVDALDGAPGVYSSSYGGAELNDTQRCEFLLSNMEKMELRDAKFVCNIVCFFPDKTIIKAAGECYGQILPAPQGTFGFGYDPVFRPDSYDKSLAELTVAEKNAVSHRGKALRMFTELLFEYVK